MKQKLHILVPQLYVFGFVNASPSKIGHPNIGWFTLQPNKNAGWFKKMDSILYGYISWKIYITFERWDPNIWSITARALA
jgi:hypothetical protein